MRIATRLLLCAGSLSTIAASASSQAPIRPGAHIRIATSAEPRNVVVGTVVRAASDSITYRVSDESRTRTIALASIGQLDISTRRHRHVIAGALIGAAGGATAGALVGWSLGPVVQECNILCPYTRDERTLIGANVGGFAGGLAGAAVGFAIVTEDWLQLHLDSLTARVGPAIPAAGRVSLGAKISF